MFYFDDFYGKKVLKSTLLNNLEHFFSTREFVLTAGEITDIQIEADKNRDFLCSKFNIKRNKLFTTKQTHSTNIVSVDKNIPFYDDCDGIILNIENSAGILNFADCVPIILYDEKQDIAAIAHAGWRGTADEIAKKTVEKMKSEFNSNVQDIIAAIGPAIGECCFSTDEDVFDKLIKDKSEKNKIYRYNKETNKYHIDLKLLNKKQLLDTGVVKIDVCDYCTSCMSNIFFSYRKESGKTSRHSAIVKLGKREKECL